MDIPEGHLQHLSPLGWDVPGTFRSSSGTWELVVDPSTNTVLHFNLTIAILNDSQIRRILMHLRKIKFLVIGLEFK